MISFRRYIMICASMILISTSLRSIKAGKLVTFINMMKHQITLSWKAKNLNESYVILTQETAVIPLPDGLKQVTIKLTEMPAFKTKYKGDFFKEDFYHIVEDRWYPELKSVESLILHGE